MHANEYQRLALRTCNRTDIDTDERRQLNAALGLAGESGEVADHIKKVMFQGHELDRGKLANEVGDVLWYCALMCESIGLTLSDVMQANIAKLQRRYPDGFDPQRSINRQGD